MPFTYITMREGTSIEHREAVSQSIHRAMVDVLGITEDDRFHVINNQGAGDPFAGAHLRRCGTRAGHRHGAYVLHPADAGNEAAALRDLVAHLGRRPGVRKEDIYISVVEPAPENWWIFGREVDPKTGFDVRMADAAKRARHDC